MIYILLSDLSVGEKNDFSIIDSFDFSADRDNKNNQKRDCRVLRQPLSLLSEGLREFIENTKNELTRSEREIAYTSLLCGLKLFFDIDDCDIRKNADGKPFLVTKSGEEYLKGGKKIYVSLSHSDGVSAVCISDEGDVGIDVQSEIDSERADRLSKRFFSEINICEGEIDADYYYCSITHTEAVIKRIKLQKADKNSFTSRWTYSESLMKLYGRGFGDLSRLEEKNEDKIIKSKLYSYMGKMSYCLVISVKNN